MTGESCQLLRVDHLRSSPSLYGKANRGPWVDFPSMAKLTPTNNGVPRHISSVSCACPFARTRAFQRVVRAPPLRAHASTLNAPCARPSACSHDDY
ncbi:hypothetical protein CRG98_014120 [Punica granatum]|uniref:Uncharacterized protein n=1 Tax=Punica granatum TaxID=22663 RepID=A0A2I0KA91_PUNGR|nr:hypothetical protein CRG98_014120 [Punica granatum]